jgi:hypothetical protein
LFIFIIALAFYGSLFINSNSSSKLPPVEPVLKSAGVYLFLSKFSITFLAFGFIFPKGSIIELFFY